MDYKKVIVHVVLFLAVYVLALRPMRVYVQHRIIVPVASHILSVPKVSILPNVSPGMYIHWDRKSVDETTDRSEGTADRMQRRNMDLFSFNGFGDKFFLLGALYFLALGFSWKPVGWLFTLHLGITALSLICLFLAVSTHPAWLYPMNLLVTYITPAATGMFVLTVGRSR